jgi:cell fate regulator YaaT (PSP1 superfamily)
MACSNCKPGNNGVPTGCGDKGHCSSGSCNKLNTFDWLTTLDIDDPNSYKYAEVSFKNGARKTFYKVGQNPRYSTGDLVIVDTGSGGYDIGRVSLMGDLVKIQMKKKNFTEDRITYEIIRKANQRDIDKMMEGRNIEKPALVKARVISRTLGLDMKIGDVEYQADLKKATFFYTSDGWVDFRELVKQYAKEFKVKIEMRQIGARQESARIGGIGACGRELCCSTWLTDFKSVNTTAARYQNIAINQSKLSGQCGRLKCCLNYELDLYIDELEKYPSNVEVLKAKNGRATLVKIDIFKEVLYYQYEPERGRSIVMPLNPDEVRRIKSMNERGEYPDDIVASESENQIDKVVEQGYSDVTGAVELPNEKRKKRKKKKPGQNARQESKVDSSNEGSVQDREPRKLTVTPKSKDPQITTEGSEKNLVVNKQNVQNREQSKQVQNPPKKANPNQNQGQNKNQVKNPNLNPNQNPNPNQNRNQNPNQGKENAKEPLKRELNPQKDNIVDKAIEDSEKQPLKRVLASEKIIPSQEQKPIAIDADKLESKNESNTSDTPSTNEPKSQHRMMRNNKKGKKDFYKSKNSSGDKDQKE